MNTDVQATREEIFKLIPLPVKKGTFDKIGAALVKHEAACEAKALREAADEIDGFYFGPDQDMPFTTGARHKWGAMQAAERLRARAARIEAGEVEA